MTPQVLLALWRQRWGKPDPRQRAVPYESEGPNRWVERHVQSALPQARGLALLGWVCFIGLALFFGSVAIDPLQQLLMAGLIALISLGLRRYRSDVFTMLLGGLALLTTLRYGIWRLCESLPASGGWDYGLALAALALEIYAVIWLSVWYASRLWPVALDAPELPEDPQDWPKLGAFVVVLDRCAEDVRASIQALRASAWPPTKLNLYVVDSTFRPELAEMAATEKARYVVYAQDGGGHAGLINRAVAETQDPWVMLVEAGQRPHHRHIQAAVAACLENDDLGLVVTPQHFLLPSPPANVRRRIANCPPIGQLMLLGREHFMTCGGLPLPQTTEHGHLNDALTAAGASHFFLIESASAVVQCIPHPLDAGSLDRRIRLEAAAAALGFYRPLLVLAGVSLPWLYLVAGWEPWTVSSADWLAYFVPHVVQVWLLHSRLRHSNRLPFLLELKEGFLMIYIMVLTAFFAGWTVLGQLRQNGLRRFLRDQGPLHLRHGLQGLAALLNLWALGWGLWLWTDAQPAQRINLGVMMVWALGICLALAARFAVRQETLEILRQKNRLSRLRASVRLPGGKTLACQTLNFPEHRLELVSPTEAVLKPGASLQVTLFQHLEDCTFQATLLQAEGGKWTVGMDEPSTWRWQWFVQNCYVRGPDWPRWLPSAWVDQLVPPGVSQVLAWPLHRLTDLIHWADRRSRLKPKD